MQGPIRLGPYWHDIMRMIARLIMDEVYAALKDSQEIDPAD